MGSGEVSVWAVILELLVLVFPLRKLPRKVIFAGDFPLLLRQIYWISPIRRRRDDDGIDRIFALAALFAAQIEHSNSVYFPLETNASECHFGQKETSLPEDSEA